MYLKIAWVYSNFVWVSFLIAGKYLLHTWVSLLNTRVELREHYLANGFGFIKVQLKFDILLCCLL